MVCEDQIILLEMYKVQVEAYSRAAEAMAAEKDGSAGEYIDRRSTARKALKGSFTLLRSLNDHMDSHGCRPALDVSLRTPQGHQPTRTRNG